MLTALVYDIQLKNRKNYWTGISSFFCFPYIIKGRMPYGIL